MLFNANRTKLAKDGEMIKKFMERYNKVRLLNGNVGWDLIEEFPDDHKIIFCSVPKKKFYNIRFLSHQFNDD
jgi:hypothetical protein